MNKLRTRFFLLVLLLALLTTGVASAQQADARQIVQKVYEQAMFKSLEMRASLAVYDREGHAQKKEFLYRRVNAASGSKTRVDMISPAEEKGVVLLALQQQGSPASQYVYTPAIDRVRSLGAQERTARFLGSDFVYDDFADRNPNDFTFRLLSDSETIDGHETYKIESRTTYKAGSPYAYVYLWVAKDAPVIVFAQMYNASGTVTRVLHATDARRVGGVWGMRHTEVSTVAEHTRTTLVVQNAKLNAAFDEVIFSPQSLGSAASPRKK